MRIAIIGGGVAGLGAAWLLSDHNDVTVFEATPRFGGHAHTVSLDIDGEPVFVDAGFEFFANTIWPTFCRLLAALNVETRDYPVRIAVFRKGGKTTRVLPPAARHLLRGPVTGARTLLDLTQLGAVLASVAPIIRARDTSPTVGEVIDRLPLTASFRDEFLFPYLLGGWCVEPEEFRDFVAYDVFSYTFASLSWKGGIPLKEVVGGTRSYVDALLRSIPGATLRASCPVAGLVREGGGFRVRERDGVDHRFDHVILAINARDACALLDTVSGTERVREHLARIAYFRTTIAVHEDRRLMPADERDWSEVNVRYDGHHAQTTVWKPWRSKRPVFRSWVTYDAAPPDRLHQVIAFDHPKVTRAYFETQRVLASEQGKGGLWFAGMHTHDNDSHESALVSGVKVVRTLSPRAPRLAAIAGP
ncbi:MAG: FAD-dependent oxidoreductase [Polyangiaceae bacterium]